MNALTQMPAETAVRDVPLTLRVLSGRSQGAEHRLPEGRRLAIGHSFENDIVLRDRSTRGCALWLVTASARPTLRVQAGSVQVLGRDIGVGEEIRLEPYLPVRIGDLYFAVGADDETRWSEAGQTIAEEQSEAALPAEVAECPPTDLAERIELRSRPARARVSRSKIGPRMMALGGAALLCIAAGSHFGARLTGEYSQSPQTVRSDLAAAGFAGLSVEQSESGQVAIAGYLRDEAQLGRLRRWAGANHPAALVKVETASAAAAAASELLTAQNVEGDVRVTGNDSLEIEAAFLPRDRQTELTGLLRRDLPGLGAIRFTQRPGAGEADLAYFFNAPGYGAASFVAGDPGYIVTEDGTRWFAGAALPTGHRIVEIGEGSLTVERDGLRDILVM